MAKAGVTPGQFGGDKSFYVRYARARAGIRIIRVTPFSEKAVEARPGFALTFSQARMLTEVKVPIRNPG
jgi:hypothetical protein